MAGWSGSAPVVSVVCTTYNHEKYLEDAVRGFLLQETDFPFEIFFHDDLSTDSTRDIIDRYEAAYPAIIRKVYQEENQYSQGVKILLLSARYAAGKFIAFCEGDDFWVAPDKLQTQVEAIKEFPACEMCFHSAFVVRHETVARNLFCRRARGNRLFAVGPIIRCGGSFMPTASMLIRRSFFDRAFQDTTGFFERYLMGNFCQIFCSLSGGALYIDRPMSVYRSFSEGSWTQTLGRDLGFYKKWLNDYLTSLREADVRTKFQYTRDFLVPIRLRHLSVLNNPALDLDFRRSYFAENRAEVSTWGKVLWYGLMRWPVLHRPVLGLRSRLRKLLRRG